MDQNLFECKVSSGNRGSGGTISTCEAAVAAAAAAAPPAVAAAAAAAVAVFRLFLKIRIFGFKLRQLELLFDTTHTVTTEEDPTILSISNLTLRSFFLLRYLGSPLTNFKSNWGTAQAQNMQS